MRRRVVYVVAGLTVVAAVCVLAGRGGPPGDRHDARSAGVGTDAHSGTGLVNSKGAGGGFAERVGRAEQSSSLGHVDARRPVGALHELPDSVRDQPWRAPFYCPADFNKDDQVDDRDVEMFSAVYAAQDGPMAEWLDLDRDGGVTGDDVASFFNAYMGSDCDPAGRAAMREDVCRTLAAHHQDQPTVAVADGSLHVQGNGFSLTAELRPDGIITTMTMVEVSFSEVQADFLAAAHRAGVLLEIEASQLDLSPPSHP